MTRQLGEIETTSREVLPMMQKMVATLDQFVKLDVPFLPEERTNRIAALKDMMTRADVSVSEKYRRIVEAYQIEIEYGRTIEAYQGKVGDKHGGLPARRPRRADVPDARRQRDRLLGRRRARSGWRTTTTRRPSRPASRSRRSRPRRISSVVPCQRSERGEVMKSHAIRLAAVLPRRCCCCVVAVDALAARARQSRRAARADALGAPARSARQHGARSRVPRRAQQAGGAARRSAAPTLAAQRARGASARRPPTMPTRRSSPSCTTQLDAKAGNLGEMFGVVRQVANDFSSVVHNSLISAQYPGPRRVRRQAGAGQVAAVDAGPRALLVRAAAGDDRERPASRASSRRS